ncbi:hypothetical protein B0T11DRAFT_66597 [Plectosphaerella cucumerina]|uniref:DUF1308 domain-containing protein n=1 Tax=Plectosphaerella cucumerina TaxID=40658 RepID=A0A8K0X7J7_9PEZI|nr:hypothetical protein B0T11DRAFT_66597 [Plectosphaerella cucumerina]
MQAHRDVVQECETITHKIKTLLTELQQLKEAVEARPAVGTKPLPWNQAITGLGAFERVVLAEKRNVANMLRQATVDTTEDGEEGTDLGVLAGRLRIKLDACNHKFHDIVWDTAKKCNDLCGIRCEYFRTLANRKTEAVIVDIVAGGGTEWIKIVTTTERRICYEMTDAGWDWETSDDDEDDDEPPLPEDGDNEVEVARAARHLVAAARLTYVEYRRPAVKIILSRITSGSNAHVDRLLRYVRTFGGDEVELSIETADQSPLLQAPPPTLDEALPRLISHDPFRDFTPTLNVDCSVFMALASDFSHMVMTPDNPLLRCKQHHIDANDEMEYGPRLLTTMYPAMVGRDLVCTQDAADTFLKIAYDIGTETEQARARILFKAADDKGDDTFSEEEDRRRRIAELARLSVYDVPEDLRLPIRTVGTVTWDDAQRLVNEGALPRVALVVGSMGSGLNAMNVSSFLYGWSASLTTITSNWEAAKRLRSVIEANRTAAEERGPHIWRIPFARKLLAKPRVAGHEHAPIKTRRERKQEKLSSLQRWVGDEEEAADGVSETASTFAALAIEDERQGVKTCGG